MLPTWAELSTSSRAHLSTMSMSHWDRVKDVYELAVEAVRHKKKGGDTAADEVFEKAVVEFRLTDICF